MEANEHQSVTNVDTRDMVDRVCVGDHKTVPHTSIYNLLASSFQGRFLKLFSL